MGSAGGAAAPSGSAHRDAGGPSRPAARPGGAADGGEFYDDVSFRLTDLAEHPSARRVLRLKRLPGVIMCTEGRERRRWQGRVEKRWVASALAAHLERGGDPL